jgi:hypothetical protein
MNITTILIYLEMNMKAKYTFENKSGGLCNIISITTWHVHVGYNHPSSSTLIPCTFFFATM